MPQLNIPAEMETLPNGLRVVISPDASAPIALVGVYYQIGFRLEPHGRSGFAHLFEHMMFQGSEHAGKMEHIRLVNASGGVLNGSTAHDVTNYFEVVPSNALERMLWLEADRMRALKVDNENLRNQRDVVKEEVRVNVMNQPYGGFPWLDLPPVAFRNWSNAHNFYGDFADLDAANLGDVQNFFHTYYAPNNAALVIVGDVDVKQSFAMARQFFGDIPRQPQIPRADVAEPQQTEERRGEVEEKFGQIPALAIGYRAAERHEDDWCAAAILDRSLHEGRAGRVYRELVLEKQIALEADGGVNFGSGDLFDYNGPTLQVTRIFHKPEYSPAQVIAAFDDVIAPLRKAPVSSEELEQVKTKLKADFYSMLESGAGSGVPRFGLMHALACFTLFENNPGRINAILDELLAVSTEQIHAAAEKRLRPECRSILIRRPVTPSVPPGANAGTRQGATR